MKLIGKIRARKRTARALELTRPKPRSRLRRGPARLMEFIPWCSVVRRDGTPLHRSPRHLLPLVETLERTLEEQVELCFSVPPRHGKSTTILYYIAWLLSQDPTKRILYLSHGKKFSERQIKKARKYALAAGVELGDFDVKERWSTREGGEVMAASIDHAPTGEGFDVVIVDDPHANRAEAESRIIRDKVFEGFLDDVYTRQEPGAVGKGTSFIIVHTRWHEDDLIGSLTRPSEDEDGVEPFKLINLPAVNEAGEALAPEMWPLEKLKKFAQRVGPYGWASLFMGAPKPRGGRLFGDAHLCEDESVPTEGVHTIGIDLAHTAKTRSDWNAAVVMLRGDRRPDGGKWQDGQPRYWVVDARHAQGRLTDFISREDASVDAGFATTIASLQATYPGARTAMYTGKQESLALELLRSLEKGACDVEDRPAITDKWQRAQPFAVAWNEGRVFIPRMAPWASAFIGELCGFTGKSGDRDDYVDAGATAYDLGTESGGSGGVTSPSDDETRLRFGLSGRRKKVLYT